MKLEKIGIIAEIVGTTAIVVTLVLVLYELRQNTAASYAASWDAITESQIDWRMAMVTNPELRAAWSERTSESLRYCASVELRESLLRSFVRTAWRG